MKKKLTAVALIVCMLAIMLVGASLAYFTDTTEAKENTFTMGSVEIELTETKWDALEKNADGELKVAPGVSYDKDPTITVGKDSEDCYLIATVTISKLEALKKLYENDQTGVKQPWGLSLAGNGKMVSGGVADLEATPAVKNDVSGTMLGDVAFITYEEKDDTIIYTYFFEKIHSAGDTEVLFEQVNVPSIIKDDSLKGLKVTVKAYAIQEAGMTNVYDAWAKFDGEK